MRLVVVLVLCIQLYLAESDCPSDFCPPNQTCCPGPYPWLTGCCPSPNAVCCSDGLLHCCPTNTVCNTAKGTCDRPGMQMIPSVFFNQERPEKNIGAAAAAQEVQVKAKFVTCPDGLSLCPDGNTCCMLSSGQWGCCPYPSAVCCNDKLHCCPQGTTCDASSQYCLQAGSKLSVAVKMLRTPALSRE